MLGFTTSFGRPNGLQKEDSEGFFEALLFAVQTLRVCYA